MPSTGGAATAASAAASLAALGLSASSSGAAPRPRASMGQLSVEVLRASGRAFEEQRGAAHRIRLTLGHTSHQSALKKAPGLLASAAAAVSSSSSGSGSGSGRRSGGSGGGVTSSSKQVDWGGECFEFPVGLPTDLLSVQAIRGQGVAERVVGSLSVALAHLPQSAPICKYFELRAGGQSVGVLQLRLTYTLSYSLHRRDAAASLTVVPSQPAREFLRTELARYAASNRISYRLVEYFLVIGCAAPQIEWEEVDGCSRSPHSNNVAPLSFGESESRTNSPAVLERYPLANRPDFALPPQLEHFVFPLGYELSTVKLPVRTFSFRLQHQTTLHADQSVAVVLCYWKKVLVRAHAPEEGLPQREEGGGRSRSGTGGAEREPSRSHSSSRNNASFGADDGTDPSAAAPASSAPRLRAKVASLKSHYLRPSESASDQGAPLTPSYRVTPAASAAPSSAGSRHRSIAGTGSGGFDLLSPAGGLASNRTPSPLPPRFSSPSTHPSPHSSTFGGGGGSSSSLAGGEEVLSASPLVSEHSGGGGSQTPPRRSDAAAAAATSASPPAVPGAASSGLFLTMYAPTALVIVSRLSFIPQYTDMLVTIYRHFLSQQDDEEDVHAEAEVPPQQHHHEASPEAPAAAGRRNKTPRCPVCIDPAVDGKSCAMATAALAHHNSAVATALQAQPHESDSDAQDHASHAAKRSTTIAAAAPIASAVPSAPASSAAAPAKQRHRMDLSGVSSNMWQHPEPEAAQHQPDISAVGSLPVPPTPMSNRGTPVTTTTPSLPHFPEQSPLPPAALQQQSPEHSQTHAPAWSSATLPPPLGLNAFSIAPFVAPFVPFPAFASAEGTSAVPGGSPSSSAVSVASSAALASASPFCNSQCCACSCCSVRVDCRGLTLEQCVLYLVDEAPLPQPGSTAGVALHLCCRTIRLRLPASELDFPQLEFKIASAAATTAAALRAAAMAHHSTFDRVDAFRHYAPPSAESLTRVLSSSSSLGLLDVLDLEVVLLLLRCLLCEMKVILFSSSLSLLHAVGDSLTSLLFPFAWSHIYIPLLPRQLYGMMEAPVSFLVGIHSSGVGEVERMLGKTSSNGGGGAGRARHGSHDSEGGNGSTTPSGSSPFDGGGGGGGGDSSPCSDRMPTDLSSFAFADLDLGMVDVAVPPPPFPTAAVRSLVREVRERTRPELCVHDELAAAAATVARTAQEGTDPKQEQHSSGKVSQPSTQLHCDGGDFHVHYHPMAASTAPAMAASPAHNHADAAPALSIRIESNDAPSSSSRSPFLVSFLPCAPPSDSRASEALAASAALAESIHAHTRMLDRSLRVAFLQFLASLISNYRDYLFFVQGATPVFDTVAFLALKGGNAGGAAVSSTGTSGGNGGLRSDALPFLSRFLDSQIFRDFLDKHVEFPSYLQDYLLYINAHAGGSHDSASLSASGGFSAGEEAFDVPPPAQLAPAAMNALLYSKASFYARQLDTQPRALEDSFSSSVNASTADVGASCAPSAAVPEHLQHASLYTSAGWDAAYMPVLGLLSAGALPPDLPTKLRSRANSTSNPHGMRGRRLSADSGSDASAAGDPYSPLVSSPQSSPMASSPSSLQRARHIFPRARRFAPDEMHGGVSTPRGSAFAQGKNPSTLSHTLLFSKLFDAVASLSGESHSGSDSGNTPRVLTPKYSPGSILSAGGQSDGGSGSGDNHASPNKGSTIFRDTASPAATGSKVVISASSPGATTTPAAVASPLPISSPIRNNRHALTVPGSDASSNGGSSRRSASPLSVSVPSDDHLGLHAPQQVRSAQGSHSNTFLRVAAPDSLRGCASASPPSVTSSLSMPLSTGGLYGSSFSGRPAHQRQMSSNLLHKSEFEKKKSASQSRLGQVVNALMASRFISQAGGGGGGGGAGGSGGAASGDHFPLAPPAHVDLGELSAVGELLALSEWRQALVNVFGSSLGLYAEDAPHRCLPTSSFLSLSLLFNIALEECASDRDYGVARWLLSFAGKIYDYPGIENEEQLQAAMNAAANMVSPKPPLTGGATTSGASASAGAAALAAKGASATRAPLEREYLRLVLRRQSLWRDEHFWRFAYVHDIQHRLDHPSQPSTPSSSGSAGTPRTFASQIPSPLTAARQQEEPSPSALQAARESTIFELVCGQIYLHLSLGQPPASVRSVVGFACQHFGLADEKRNTLHQLVDNIARSQASTIADDSTYTPGPQVRPLHAREIVGATSGARRQHTPHTPNSHTLQYPANDED